MERKSHGIEVSCVKPGSTAGWTIFIRTLYREKWYRGSQLNSLFHFKIQTQEHLLYSSSFLELHLSQVNEGGERVQSGRIIAHRKSHTHNFNLMLKASLIIL